MKRLLCRLRLEGAGVLWRAWGKLRPTVTVHCLHGLMTVSTRDQVIGRGLFVYGQSQHDLTVRATAFLRQRGLIPPRGQGAVLDIGANIGLISIGLLCDGEFASGIGIEPDPYNFQLFQRNVQQNGLRDRYTALQLAASDREGVLEFALSEDNLADHRVRAPGAGGRSDAPADDRKVISVPAKTVDAALAELPPGSADAIALVWIDVQGHEGFVFTGSPGLFSRRIPVVAEVWPGGLNQSGMGVPRFCEVAASYWSHFWVWRRCGRFIQYPISELPKFCEELGDGDEFDDVIFTRD